MEARSDDCRDANRLPPAHYEVELTWTSYGIPHVRAGDYASLAFGAGYAFASHNADLIADAVLTVRGTRAKYLGDTVPATGSRLSNLQSDLFHRFYLDPDEREAGHLAADPEVAAMLSAYACGVRRAIREQSADCLNAAYRDAFVDRPIGREDLCLLLAQRATQTSGGMLATAMLRAQPPGSLSPTIGAMPALAERTAYLGSNGFVFGRDLVAGRTGLLLGNPHFPWTGALRFFQIHLTIPGELDVMGASLPPFPVVNIGFNHDVAWTHTVSSSRRFAIHELRLDPRDPLRYRRDGRWHDMEERLVCVEIGDGSKAPREVTHTFFSSCHGPVIVVPQMHCTWSRRRAYALADATKTSTSMVRQWLTINKARSVADVREALCRHRGALWLNTLATDRHGDVFFGDLSAVPRLPRARLFDVSLKARLVARAANVPILCGEEGPVAANDEPLRSDLMPQAVRSDYFINCNDSHWLANASAPLTGFARHVGRERTRQGMRTRMAYHELRHILRGRNSVSEGLLQRMIFSNRNHAADLILDDLLRLDAERAGLRGDDARKLEHGLDVLRHWSRRDDPDSEGAVLFRELWRRLPDRKTWRHRFDADDPLRTPAGLRIEARRVARMVGRTLVETVDMLARLGLSPSVRLGAVQHLVSDGETIEIPGGLGAAGVLNLVDFGPLGPAGYDGTEIQGTSYTQVVTWVDGRVVARAILPFSQSADPRSPHHRDQTRLFAAGQWIELPFHADAIVADSRSPSRTIVSKDCRPSQAAGNGGAT